MTQISSLEKIAYINSGKYSLLVADLKKNTVIYGRNNSGKTSFLNGLRLFLPEENLKLADLKFGFKDEQGNKFTAEQSHNFYFPELNSFIILEVKNRHGVFCQILNKSIGGNMNEYGYGRINVPKSFDEIKDLFWDFTKYDDAPIGKPIDSTTILTELKRIPESEVLTNRNAVLRSSYHHPSEDASSSFMSVEKGRYKLFPFYNKNKSSESTVMKLLKMSNDINHISKGEIIDVMANTINLYLRNSDEDKLDYSVDEAVRENDILKERHSELVSRKNQAGNIKKINDIFNAYESNANIFFPELGVAFEKYALSRSYCEQRKESLNKKRLSSKERVEYLREAEKEIKSKGEANKNLIIALNSQIDDIKSRIKDVPHIPNKPIYQLKKQNLNDMDLVFREVILELESQIRKYEEYKTTSNTLKKLNQDLKRKQNLYNKTLEEIENIDSLIVSKLPKEKAVVAGLLNTELLNGKSDDAKLISFINLISEYFEVNDDYLLSKTDSPLRISNMSLSDVEGKIESFKEDKKNSLVKIENSIASIKRDIAEINDMDSPIDDNEEDMREIISKKTTILNEVNADKISWRDFESNKRTIADHNKIILEKEEENNLLRPKIVQATQERKEQEATYQMNDQEFHTFQNKLWELDQVKAILKECMTLSSEPFDVQIEKSINKAKHRLETGQFDESLLNMNQGDISKLEDLHKILVRDRNRIHDSISFIINDNLKGINLTPIRLDSNMKEIKENIHQLNMYIDNIEKEWKEYESDVVDFKNRVYSIGSSILEHRKLISTFENDVNKSLSSVQISNLESVEIAIDIDKNFNRLCENFDVGDIDGNDFVDDAFLETLREVCKKMNLGNDDSVTMEKIIKGFHFIYKEPNQTPTTKPQSNGTSIMSRIALFTYLIEKNTISGFKASLPIVLDEAGNLDNINFKALTDFVSELGYTLFAATPTRTPSLSRSMDVSVNLGIQLYPYPYSPERSIVWCPEYGDSYLVLEQNVED